MYEIERADLHRHLDGSLRELTLLELAQKFNVKIPSNFRFKERMSLPRALSYFITGLKLLQEKPELIRIASEVCEDAASDNVSRLEIRFGPHLHQEKGLQLEEVIDSVLEGINGRAGLILCGLYGDDPKLLLEFVKFAKTREGVVAIDLAGSPTASDNFHLSDYKKAYQLARDLGINRTVHASEGRDPQEIITAISELHAQRIGHATTLLESPEALELVLDKNIVIESCPTSNIHCNVVPSYEEHPLPKWLELGVKASINTDNTFFSNVSSSQEHLKTLDIKGMNQVLLNKAIQNGLNSTFSR